MGFLRAFFPLLLIPIVLGAPQEDKIINLPGLDYPTNYDQYSGYLQGTEGRRLHYWLTNSQSNPSTDPLLLWLNGGPGCSSLMGLLTELGPFRVSKDDSGTLIPNPYAWNNAANVLFLESPACVGFSYDESNNCATGDKEVAEMNYLALKDFFQKFPEYVGRNFYITGESYAGVYIPTLSVKIVEGMDTYPINFQGYAIGNGLLSYDNNDNSLIFFGHYHALIGESLWENLVAECCDNGIESQETCKFIFPVSKECSIYSLQAFNIIYNSGLNIYNLYGECLKSGDVLRRNQYSFDMENLFRKFSKPELYSDPPCTDNSHERKYLNDPQVRTALHIPEEVQAWDICSDDVAAKYHRDYTNTTTQLSFLQSSKIKGLIYNGDVDMACNYLGNDWDISTLGLSLITKHREWSVGGQVAGFVDEYEDLVFLTVKGSGHMVPADKPEEALYMITAFINDDPY